MRTIGDAEDVRQRTVPCLINNLKGFSEQQGGSINLIGASFGLEDVSFMDPGTGEIYSGVTLSEGAAASVPFEIHSTTSYTVVFDLRDFENILRDYLTEVRRRNA